MLEFEAGEIQKPVTLCSSLYAKQTEEFCFRNRLYMLYQHDNWGITRALGSGLQPCLNFGLRAPTQGLRAPTLGLRAPTLGLRALYFYVKIWDPLLFEA